MITMFVCSFGMTLKQQKNTAFVCLFDLSISITELTADTKVKLTLPVTQLMWP